jgi:DNA repair exonuclease SbcCD ATPase subunit
MRFLKITSIIKKKNKDLNELKEKLKNKISSNQKNEIESKINKLNNEIEEIKKDLDYVCCIEKKISCIDGEQFMEDDCPFKNPLSNNSFFI